MNIKQRGGIRRKLNNNSSQNNCPICFDPVNTNGIILNCECTFHLTCFISYLKGALRNKDNYFTEAGLRCISENHRNEPNMSFNIDELDQLIDLLNSEDIKILVMSNTNSNLNLNTNNKYNSFLGTLREKFKRFTEHVNVVVNATNISNSRVYASIISRPCPCGRFEGIHYHGHYCHILSCGVCNIQYCVQCGGVDERIKALHNEDDNYILCRCASSGMILGHTFCANNDILENLDGSQKNVPLDGRCRCPICPDCKPGVPCEYCPGGCVVCNGIVLPGPMGLNNARKWIPVPRVEKWDLARILSGHIDSIKSISWNPNNKFIVSGSLDASLRIWNIENETYIQTLNAHSKSITCVSWSNDGNYIVSTSTDKLIKLWDANSGICINTFGDGVSKMLSVCWSPDSNFILTGSSNNNVIIWDPISGDLLYTLQGHSAPVLCVLWGNDGRYIASGSDDKTIRIWDTNDYQCIKVIEDNNSSINCIVFNNNGTQLAASSGKTVKVWNTASWDLLPTYITHTDFIYAIAYSNDGSRIVSSSKKNIKIWDTESWRYILTLDKSPYIIRSICFSKDDNFLAVAGDNKVISILKRWN